MGMKRLLERDTRMKKKFPESVSSLRTVVVTDCGSTTTKALLFEKTPDGWRQTFRGEAPTTVEEPVADVTIGALNAFQELEELSGRRILRSDSSEGDGPFLMSGDNPEKGIDLFLSTSSAGGGLQMMVAGIVREMTTESAQRAALGAGAIVLDYISADDGREDHERIRRIRQLRPDIVLLAGGVDGGSRSHVIEAAEMLRAAAPRPRFGSTLTLPVIYAGNNEAAGEVSEILAGSAQVKVVPNVRPTLERENLGPAREAIHEFFLSHVMSHSPGYGKLMDWSPVSIMPTPAAVGEIVQQHAHKTGLQILCADIGGATTDVFSVFRNHEGRPVFNRTVSANLGMSYSIANVLIEAGVAAIRRWLPYAVSESELKDRLRNKMIRPTTVPQTLEDLWLEQAVCREALRLSLEHHRQLAVGLGGVQQKRGIADLFTQERSRYELVNLKSLDLVIGSGGVLSHAPDRMSAALMMLDGFALEGLTRLAVDSIFMMPHLGVLASVEPQASEEIFLKDCLVHLGHAVAPRFSRKKQRRSVADIFFNDKKIASVVRGAILCAGLEPGSKGLLRVEPESRDVDVGTGPGNVMEQEIEIGLCGILLDGRNRPIEFGSSPEEQQARQKEALVNLGLGGAA